MVRDSCKREGIGDQGRGHAAHGYGGGRHRPSQDILGEVSRWGLNIV